MKKMVSDLLSGVLQTLQAIIGENSELLPWEKDVCNNCGQHEIVWKAFISQWDPPPHFQLFYFNDRLDFVNFLNES